MLVTNHYEHCDEQWSVEDCETSFHNDRCPVCNKEITPYQSTEYTEEGTKEHYHTTDGPLRLAVEFLAYLKESSMQGIEPAKYDVWLDRRFKKYQQQCDRMGIFPMDFEQWKSSLETVSHDL